ncbi:Heat shock 70 kDa protein 8 [Cardamine amara subsp. amara]|uniref:Heat shock 70 kDa protein 8 n=1 Tax=Cardamine amara subsp. amara TaxID=228776 RepID=A0ABD1BVX5_CARAN
MAEQAYTVASDSENTGEEKSSSSPPSLPEIAVGIDIGTSQCSIAVWNGSQVHILRNTRNQKLIKSFVTFKDEVPAGGVTNQLAHDQEMLTGASIFNMKRLIGRVDTDPVVHATKNLPFLVQTLDIGVRPFIAALVNNAWRSTTPEEVLAIFLVELRLMAEAQLKRPVRNVVLTVPVSFSRFQLTRFERACAMAGLHVLRLMPEPTAIALLYAQQQQMTTHDNMGSGSERLAVIFNMGAGYCDVAVTATAGGVSQIKALAGNPIGGEDILQNTMRHIAPPNEEASSGLLRVAVQDAIHRLSDQDNVQIEVDLGNGNKISKVLDRLEFEEVNKKVFEECERLVVQCLRDAKIETGDIDDLIMVGGCSYIPRVRTILKNVCKKDEIYKGVHPLEGAVRGAALEGAVTSGIHDPFGSLDLLTIQATALAVGVRANDSKFIPVIPRNMMVPARKDLFFTTVHDNQKEALIIVYEGEGESVEENHLLGYFKIVGIPPSPKGVPEINVCMDIDASNALRVFAAVLMPGSSSPVVPVVEVRMPTVDDGHGWCTQALNVKYGSTLDLVSLQRKM